MSQHIVAFDRARILHGEDQTERSVDIDLGQVEHVRWMMGKQAFHLVGANMIVALSAETIAAKFRQAGITVYVLEDMEKDNEPVIIPVDNVEGLTRYWNDTIIQLKRATKGARELIVRGTPGKVLAQGRTIELAL